MRIKKLIKKLKKILKERGNDEVVIVFDGDTRTLYNASDVYVHPVVEACVVDAGRH